MAQFNGFTCDECDNVVSKDARIKRIIRLEGPASSFTGEIHHDLCLDCAGEYVETHREEIRPLRTRKKGSQEPQDRPQEPEEDEPVRGDQAAGLPRVEGSPQPLPG